MPCTSQVLPLRTMFMHEHPHICSRAFLTAFPHNVIKQVGLNPVDCNLLEVFEVCGHWLTTKVHIAYASHLKGFDSVDYDYTGQVQVGSWVVYLGRLSLVSTYPEVGVIHSSRLSLHKYCFYINNLSIFYYWCDVTVNRTDGSQRETGPLSSHFLCPAYR